MKTLLLTLALLVFSPFQDGPMPDRWRGLVVDQSTPEDAVKAFGSPRKDTLRKLEVRPVEHWVSAKRKEKVFRALEYKNPSEGVEKATLFFLDNKLVSMLLDLKEGSVSPNGLNNVYGIEFTPLFSNADLAMSPRDFERREGKVYARSYPTVYHLAAVSDRSFVTAMIANVPSMLGALGKSAGVQDKPGSYPGKVAFVQIISRSLENRDGADVLK